MARDIKSIIDERIAELTAEPKFEAQFCFSLSPSFWASARSKVDAINDDGGFLELHESNDLYERQFVAEGDDPSVVEMKFFVERLRLH